MTAAVLQEISRSQAVRATVATAESALQRIDHEIANAQGIVEVAQEKVRSLTDERERMSARLEAAQKAVEALFDGRSREYRERLVFESDRPERETLPPTPPARVHFTKRAANEPRLRGWDPATHFVVDID